MKKAKRTTRALHALGIEREIELRRQEMAHAKERFEQNKMARPRAHRPYTKAEIDVIVAMLPPADRDDARDRLRRASIIDESAEPVAASVIGAAIRFAAEISKKKYDGIAGSLPNWMPGAVKREFIALRSYLLDLAHGNLDTVRGWLRERGRRQQILGDQAASYPSHVEYMLTSLLAIERLVLIGMKSGRNAMLDAYLGDKADEWGRTDTLDRAAAGRKSGQTRRGNTDERREWVREIASRLMDAGKERHELAGIIYSQQRPGGREVTKRTISDDLNAALGVALQKKVETK